MIQKGIYSVENGKLVQSSKGYILVERSEGHASPLATIESSLPGIPQLHIRERSAEEVLKKHLPIHVIPKDQQRSVSFAILVAMEEYRSQPSAPVSDDISAKILNTIDSYWKFDGRQHPMSNWHDKQDLMDEIRKILSSLSHTQSGYTREQVGDVDKCLTFKGDMNYHPLDILATESYTDLANDVGVTDKESYLEGFNDGYHKRAERFPSLTAPVAPSITSIEIGEGNSIVNVKYK